MWSHYADSHRGICLVFDWQNEFFAQAFPVIYQKKRPLVNPIFQSHEKMLDHALLTKSDHWEYEKEWRIVQYRQGAGTYKFPAQALVGIVLGSQISSASRAKVEGWAVNRSVPLAIYHAYLSETDFAIHIAPC